MAWAIARTRPPKWGWKKRQAAKSKKLASEK
jgi:hypothetical protein